MKSCVMWDSRDTPSLGIKVLQSSGLVFLKKQLLSSRHKWIETSVFLLAILFWIRVELTNNLKKFTSHKLLVCEMHFFHVYKVVSDHFQASCVLVHIFLLCGISAYFCTTRVIYVIYFFLNVLSIFFPFSESFNGFFAFQYQANAGKMWPSLLIFFLVYFCYCVWEKNECVIHRFVLRLLS